MLRDLARVRQWVSRRVDLERAMPRDRLEWVRLCVVNGREGPVDVVFIWTLTGNSAKASFVFVVLLL